MDPAWSYKNEMEYVQSLISGSAWDRIPAQPRHSTKWLLNSYVRNARKRVVFGTYVDRGKELIAYIERILKEM